MICLVSRSRKEKDIDPLFKTAAGILIGVTGLILLVLWEPVPFFRSFALSVGGGRLALYLLLPLMLLLCSVFTACLRGTARREP